MYIIALPETLGSCRHFVMKLLEYLVNRRLMDHLDNTVDPR